MKEKNDLIREQAKRLHLSNIKNKLDELLKTAQSRQFSYESFLEYLFSQELKCRANTACQKLIFPALSVLKSLTTSI